MPKRRNKVDKPALNFVESPVHIVHNPPDLVFASDNPPTADVVALDNDANVTWVSPQFRGNPTPGPKRRRNKSQLSTLTTRSRHRSGHANNTTVGGIGSPSRKFPALDFVGEEIAIQSASSPEVHVSVSEEILAIPRPEEDGNKERRKSRKRRSITPKGPNCDTPVTQDNPENCSENKDEESESDSPVVLKVKASTGKRQKVKVKKKKSRLRDLAAELDFTPDHENENGCTLTGIAEDARENEEGQSERRINRNPKLVEESSSPQLTQMRPKSSDKPQRKRLFNLKINNNVGSPDNSNSELYMQEFDLIKPRSMRSTRNNCSVNADDGSAELSTSPKHGAGQSTRLQLLKRNVFSPLLRTPTHDAESKRQPVILAYDTPEEEYGLSIRQRRLHRLRRQKRKSAALH